MSKRKTKSRTCHGAAAIVAAAVTLGAAPAAHAMPPPNDAPSYQHAQLHRRLPPVPTQYAVRANHTLFGSCRAAGGGKVVCDPNRRMATLRLPASFAVKDHTVSVNEQALEAFRQVVDHIDRKGYGPRVKQFDMGYPRQCKYATGGYIPKCISMHSWGIAVDINNSAYFNKAISHKRFERNIGPIAKIFQDHGFKWGKYFDGNYDPPHFQYARTS